MYGSGFNQGFGGGYNQGYGGGYNQGSGFINLGGASNGYGGNNSGFVNMGGWSYNGNWNANNDAFLQSQIERVYMMYDFNRTGQLEGQ